VEQARALDPDAHWKEVSLVLMDDDGMAKVNSEHLGKPHPTDVISFSYASLPGEPEGASGEVLVNVERAVVEGRRRKSPSLELALYIAHGCLHLAGETDDTPGARQRMQRREKMLLSKTEDVEPIANLFDEGGKNT
jgi:probable rRNA maturation factor